MGKRKGFGNPLSRALGKALDTAAPGVLDGFMEVATGPKKGSDKKKLSSSSSGSTDWHTRVPGTPRKRH